MKIGLVMKNWRALSLFLFVFAFLFCSLTQAQKEKQINFLDQQIHDIKDQQLKHRSRAIQSQNLGMRLQFQRNQFTAARQAFNDADEQMQKVEELQQALNALERKKAAIQSERTVG